MGRLVVALAALLAGGVAHATSPAVPAPSDHGVFSTSSYREALARARARKVLLFVDAWAPWCHTCLFFRERVAPEIDRVRVAAYAEFAAVDTEDGESGAAFLAKHPMTEWPTFFAIDPRTEKVRWMSSKLMTAREIEGVVRREGVRYRNDFAAARAAGVDVVARASAMRARGEFRAAATILEAELARTANRARHAEILETLVSVTLAVHANDRCMNALSRVAPGLSPSERAPALANGLACASSEAMRRPEAARALLSLAEESVRAPELLADERSTLFEGMVALARALGDDVRAREVAMAWVAFLEREASLASSPGARAVFDAHRVGASLALGDPSRALAAVEQTSRESPGDGHTQLRYAVLLRELGRSEEALAHVDSALGTLHGPRRVRAFEVRASIHRREGRHEEAAAALLDAVHEARAWSSDVRGEALVKRLTGELAYAKFAALLARPSTGELPAIIEAGDPTLRLQALDVPAEIIGTPELERLVTLMVAVMRNAPGVGLAAPQLGLPWRLFVFEDTEARMAKLSAEERLARGRVEQPLTVVVNPNVSRSRDAEATYYEGCLSIRGFAAAVPRALHVTVTALDAGGKPLELELRGWPARIVQHEVDHLEGTLYVDRMFPRSFATGESAKRFVHGRPIDAVLDAYRARARPEGGPAPPLEPLRTTRDRPSVRTP